MQYSSSKYSSCTEEACIIVLCNSKTSQCCSYVHTYIKYIYMLNKNTLGVKKVRGQSEATMVI